MPFGEYGFRIRIAGVPPGSEGEGVGGSGQDSSEVIADSEAGGD